MGKSMECVHPGCKSKNTSINVIKVFCEDCLNMYNIPCNDKDFDRWMNTHPNPAIEKGLKLIDNIINTNIEILKKYGSGVGGSLLRTENENCRLLKKTLKEGL